jgi:hypothetical protein
MNLVDLYTQETVFPLQKILTWSYEQQTQREMAPIYTLGTYEPRSFSRSGRTTRTATLILFGLTRKEYKWLYEKMINHDEVEDLTLRSEHGTLYLQKGYINSFGPEDPSVMPDELSRYELTINCIDVAINAYPPVTGSEAVIQLGSDRPVRPRGIAIHHTADGGNDRSNSELFQRMFLGHFHSGYSNLDGVVDGGDRGL